MNVLACCATWLVGTAAGGAAVSPWQGLDVVVESLHGDVHVNGVRIAASRFTGRGVPELVTRLEQRWASEPGSVVASWKVVGPWKVLSRVIGAVSQVLQVSDSSGTQQALLSQLDLTQRPAEIPSSTLPLPRGCRTTSTVHGTDREQGSLQLVALCRRNVASVRLELLQSARRAGFQPLAEPGDFIQLQRQALQVSAVVTAAPASQRSGMSVLVVQERGNTR